MEILVYMALALVMATLVGALFLAPGCSLGFRPLLSGYTIVIYTMILYIALSAAIPIFFNDMVSFFYPQYSGPERFFGTLMVNWLGIVLFVAFYLFITRRRGQDATPHWPMRVTNPCFPFTAYVFVLSGLAMKALFILRSGGLRAVLVTRSAGIAQHLGLSQSTDQATLYLSFFSMTADAAACWLVLEAMRSRKQVFFHTVLILATLAMTFVVTPKREVLIMPILALLVGFSTYYKPLLLSKAPLFLSGAVFFSMATLAGRIFLPAYAAGVTLFSLSRLDLLRKFAIRLLSTDIAFFDATAAGIYGKQAIIMKFGGWWNMLYRPNLEVASYAIPRFLWPGKPDNLVDVSTALLSIIEGIPLDKAQGGFGIGLIGTSWLYGGAIGLIIGMALLAMAASFVDRFLYKMHSASATRILTFAISATMLFHLYRQGTVGWVFINFFQTSATFWLTVITLAYLVSSRPVRAQSTAPALS